MELLPEDVPNHFQNSSFFSILSLPCGKLVSRYYDRKISSDIFLTKTEKGRCECFRFVAAIVQNYNVYVLAETFVNSSSQETFGSLRTAVETLNGTDLWYAREILKMLDGYEGFKQGK
uniref:Uncharacterized protein n=1 Tax=Caenorhabditis japonica TaxID=281687 RepID=A0A8R1HI29_CAEJA